MYHRKSSVGFPQSNGRAEAAVKTVKRILTTNVSPSGTLDTDEVAKALLLHRNTPAIDMGISPSELLFGRPLNDHLPSPTHFRRQWLELADIRENTLRKRFSNYAKNKPNDALKPLDIGDSVSIQNQTGNHPNRWEKTGIVAEKLPYRQYNVVVDGSRRTTLRNRKFLRKIQPETRNMIQYIPDIPDHQGIKNQDDIPAHQGIKNQDDITNNVNTDNEEIVVQQPTPLIDLPSPITMPQITLPEPRDKYKHHRKRDS